MPKADGTWHETVLQVGSPIPLQGVRTVPAVTAMADAALIILNSGLLHHVGSCCLSVQVARAAADIGVMAVRYDASGIGDSAARPSPLPQDARAVAELGEVVEALAQRHGVRRVALLGLCSGAFTAFEGAQNDARIVGITQIAPFAYRTHEWYARHYGARVLSSEKWRSFIRRKMGVAAPRPRGLSPEYLESYDAGWSVPSPEHLEAGYKRLVERGVHLLNIMTGGEAESYNYEGQFRDMFPNLDLGTRFTEWYLPDATHTITDPSHQRLVQQRVTQWLATVMAPAAAPGASPGTAQALAAAVLA